MTTAPPPRWTASWLSSLPEAQRQQFLLSLTDREAAELFHRWSFWARESQIPPRGDWRVWLLLAGRGFGKSRTGAEWVRAEVESGRRRRLALVGRTAADVRDVMIEGESGLLAVSPSWFRPKWEPSKRRLTWPNGALATTYSADKPDLLRGPQHDGFWADELACFVAGTLVETDRGSVPIERVRPGMLVQTRDGLGRVADAWCSSRNAELFALRTCDGRELVGTRNHPVWVDGQGFVPLISVPYGAILMVWDSKSELVSRGAVAGGGSTADTTATGRVRCCTGRSGLRRTDRSSRASRSTTGTATRQTIAWRTWKHSAWPTTAGSTALAGGPDGARKRGLGRHGSSGRRGSPTRWSASIAANGSSLPGPARASAGRHVGLRTGERMRRSVLRPSASTAGSRSFATAQACGSAPGGAPTPRRRSRGRSVLYAAQSSVLTERPLSAARVSAATSTATRAIAVGVRPLHRRAPVYNISVEGAQEYFANGILVHNCWRYPEAWDQLQFGLRLGDDPRGVVTTTPRPTKLVRDLLSDPGTHVTRGSTYDNRGNLAPQFFAQIIRRYEGTRLGRQELNAELLDDNPYALWQRGQLDALRVPRAPELVRIVVAIDPQAADNPEDLESAETGIVVAGRDAREHYYVLADCSLRASPAVWAQAAVTAFHAYRADRVVAEANQGGAMVEHTLRTVDARLPYVAVHASRGKLTRAEPISALYEQGRVHHVGCFPELEDQQCEWVPGERSPDRMDALVWALTALAGGGPPAGSSLPADESWMSEHSTSLWG